MRPYTRGFLRELLLGLALLLALALLARTAHGQVEPTITFHGVNATTLVRHTGRGQLTAAVSIWSSISDSSIAPVLVSPAAFTLSPQESQTVRLRARAPCNPLWRYVVFLVPDAPPVPTIVERPIARVTLAVRFVGKVKCT